MSAKQERVALTDGVGTIYQHHITPTEIERMERVATRRGDMSMHIHTRFGTGDALEENRITVIDRIIKKQIIHRIDNQMKRNDTVTPLPTAQVADEDNRVGTIIMDNRIAPNITRVEQIAANSVEHLKLINRQQMHGEGDKAVGTMHRVQLVMQRVGKRQPVPFKRRRLVGADTAVKSIDRIAPHVQVIADKAVATVLVWNSHLHIGGIVWHGNAVIMPRRRLVLHDGIIDRRNTVAMHNKVQMQRTVATINGGAVQSVGARHRTCLEHSISPHKSRVKLGRTHRVKVIPINGLMQDETCQPHHAVAA